MTKLRLLSPNEVLASLLLVTLAVVGNCFGLPTDALRTAPGLDAMAHPEFLPFLYPAGTQTLQFSSFDPSGGNNDGNFDRAFTKYIDNRSEYVVFDAYGPGCLYRQQLNVWTQADLSRGATLFKTPGAGESRLRYYFDNESEPRIDVSVDEFFDGKHAPFDAPFSFTGDWGEVLPGVIQFGIQYYPLPFAQRLKVTFVPSAKFMQAKRTDIDGDNYYNFTYLLYPPGTRLTSWSKDAPVGDAVRAAWSQVGDDPKPRAGNQESHSTVVVARGGTGVLLDSEGQGSLASLKLGMTPYSADTFFGVRIRISWDGNPPAVNMPIGVFFGGGGEDYPYGSQIPGKKLANLFYGFNGTEGTFYSYWPMPFWSSAKIEIINGTSHDVSITADIEQTPKERLTYPAGAAGYFWGH